MSHNASGELGTLPSDPLKRYLGGVFRVIVVAGVDAGANVTLNQASPARVLVGQSPVCTLRLTDREVSRRHVSLRPHAEGLVVTDVGSLNGTFVNGVRVRDAILQGGESIRIGSTTMKVETEAPAYVSLVQESSFGRVLGESRAMRAVYPLLHRAAGRDFALLLEGESGVGKRLCAEEIHARSARSSQRFVTVSCRAIPPATLEERLFGAGSLVEEAAGGTIYLDEVVTLTQELQARLLGAISANDSGVRFVFGTRHDLDREVTSDRFREDLLATLAATRIELPPLRERDGDVEKLAASFWSVLAAGVPDEPATELPSDFIARAQTYSWPGNVRELARAVYTRFSLGELARWHDGAARAVGEDAIAEVLGRELRLPEARDVVLQEFERRYVTHMLARYGSTQDAARASGVARRYFQLIRARIKG